MRRRSAPIWFVALCLLLGSGLCFALVSGEYLISITEVLQILSGGGDQMARTIVFNLRLPRALSAVAVGGQLAMAGALLQILLRNPLADPYVLGTSGGAAFFAFIAMLMGAGVLLAGGAAFVGALFSVFLVFGLSHGRGGWTPTRLLLTGVVMASGWGAMISFLLSVSPEQDLRGMVFWLMGDLSQAQAYLPGLVVLGLAALLGTGIGRSLNLLQRGELQAQALGVAIRPLRLTIYGLAALLTASAVALAGSVGFVGLVVPHLLRLCGLRDNRMLLPACAAAGGGLTLYADTVARTVMAPQQLPVGVLTALIGVPLFLVLLFRERAMADRRD